MDMSKIGVYWDLLRKGQEVADPEKWKAHQITATIVGGLIVALINLAKSYGYDLPITPDTANSLGVGVIAAVNVVLTITTSKKAGLLPAKPNGTAVPAVVEQPPTPQFSDTVQPVDSPAAEPTTASDQPAVEPTKPAVDDYIYRG